jgi:hypothetical protein
VKPWIITTVGAFAGAASAWANTQRWPAALMLPTFNPADTRLRRNSARTSTYGSLAIAPATASAATMTTAAIHHPSVIRLGLAAPGDQRLRAGAVGSAGSRVFDGIGIVSDGFVTSDSGSGARSTGVAPAIVASTEPVVIGW